MKFRLRSHDTDLEVIRSTERQNILRAVKTRNLTEIFARSEMFRKGTFEYERRLITSCPRASIDLLVAMSINFRNSVFFFPEMTGCENRKGRYDLVSHIFSLIMCQLKTGTVWTESWKRSSDVQNSRVNISSVRLRSEIIILTKIF